MGVPTYLQHYITNEVTKWRVKIQPNDEYLRSFVENLLHIILPEVTMSGVVDILNQGHRLGFAHGDHSHLELEKVYKCHMNLAFKEIFPTHLFGALKLSLSLSNKNIKVLIKEM